MSREKAPKKELFGWAMFDFANSSYTTVIITVVYSIVFPRIIVGPDAGTTTEFRDGNLYWSLAQVISYALVVMVAPIIGAISDFSASKKRFLFYSYLVTIIATAALFTVSPGNILLATILIVISNFGFATGENFVSSILPELGPPESLGRISGYAWGLGYFGGLCSVALVQFGVGSITLENFESLRLVGPITAGFFLLAGIPTFLFVRERGKKKPLPDGQSYFTIGFTRLKLTYTEIKKFKDLVIFLFSLLFAQAGLSIVISFAFIYGDQVILWDDGTKAIMFVMTQLTAAGGAFLFGYIQDKIGAKKTYNLTLMLWTVSIVLIYLTQEVTKALNGAFGLEWQAQHVFVFVGCLAGMGIGSTQSASRAMVGVFSPVSKAGEFFGFWGISTKFATIIGILGLAILQYIFGLKVAILICVLFFVVSYLINIRVDEARGRQEAVDYIEN